MCMKRGKGRVFRTSRCFLTRNKSAWFHIITGLVLLASLYMASAVCAFEIPTGKKNLSVHWDNTIKYSTAYRLEDQSDTLISDINQDDGDRNFDKGFISNRVDLLSELDIVLKQGLLDKTGLRITGAAWYDTVYNTENNNDSAATANHLSRSHDEFTDDTQDLHGRDCELLDAFLFTSQGVGDGSRVQVRVGRFAQYWGETLFYGANGIAGGMAPVDVVKALSVPGSQFKEIIRPTGQASLDYTVNANLSFGAYYQFEWEESRLPGVGSYYSSQDLFVEGGEQFFLAPGFGLARGDDFEASDQGQFGVRMNFHVPSVTTTFGLYVIRYHDKAPSAYLLPGDGEYCLAFHENIWAYGISASKTFGAINLATEVSFRDNAPLANPGVVILSGETADNDDNAKYPVGQTFHANLSAIWSMPRTPLFQEATLNAEIAYNNVVHIDDNPEALSPNSERDALGFRLLLTPTYRQVFISNLDVNVPIGLGYTMGRSGAVGAAFGNDKGGDCSIGLNFTYQQVWKAGILYTHYFGSAGTALTSAGDLSFAQSLADRDTISFNFQRTF